MDVRRGRHLPVSEAPVISEHGPRIDQISVLDDGRRISSHIDYHSLLRTAILEFEGRNGTPEERADELHPQDSLMYRDSRVERVSEVLRTGVPRREEVDAADRCEGPESERERQACKRQRQSDDRESLHSGTAFEPARVPRRGDGRGTQVFSLRAA